MKKNVIYNKNCIEGIKDYIEDDSIDLIIADPPYFKVISQKWDYIWRTEDDYVKWCLEWLSESYKKLRKGGSIYIFGYFRNLALLVPELEKIGFELRQQIIIDKGIQAVSGRATKNYKMFPNVTESILFLYKNPRPYIQEFLKEKQTKFGYTGKKINEMLGVKSNGGGMWSIYTGNNISGQIPTKEYWGKLEEIFEFEYPYEKISITFNPQKGLTDVWTDINFYGQKKRIHPTQKPMKLIDRLILTSSNEGDIVLDPFMGSATTAISCIKNNRHYIGFELDKEYYNKSLKRIERHTNLEQLNMLESL